MCVSGKANGTGLRDNGGVVWKGIWYLIPFSDPSQDSLVLAPRVHNEGVLLPVVKTSSPSLLMSENPGCFPQEPFRTETAGSRAYDLLSLAHRSHVHPGWVQRTVLRAAADPSCRLAETQEYAMQTQCSGV